MNVNRTNYKNIDSNDELVVCKPFTKSKKTLFIYFKIIAGLVPGFRLPPIPRCTMHNHTSININNNSVIVKTLINVNILKS